MDIISKTITLKNINTSFKKLFILIFPKLTASIVIVTSHNMNPNCVLLYVYDRNTKNKNC